MFARIQRARRHAFAQHVAFRNGNGLIFRERELGEFKNFFAVQFSRPVLEIENVVEVIHF